MKKQANELATSFCVKCGDNMLLNTNTNSEYCSRGCKSGSRGSRYTTGYVKKNITASMFERFCILVGLDFSENRHSFSIGYVGKPKNNDGSLNLANCLSLTSNYGVIYPQRLIKYIEENSEK